MGKSKLSSAAYDGDLDRVTALLKKKARVDGKDGDLFEDEVEGCVKGAPYYTPLTEAARAGYEDVVRALLKAHAKKDSVDYRNETALIHAATSGHVSIVNLLLERHAKIDHVGCLGTALMRAVSAGHVEVIERLFDAGADPLVGEGVMSQLDDDTGDEVLRAVAGRWKDAPDALDAMLRAAGAAREAEGMADAARASTYAALVAAADEDDWAARVTALLPAELEDGGSFMTVKRVCDEVLADPRCVESAAWGDLLTHVLGLSWSYEDLTLASYGETLGVSEMDDDEGGAMDWYADEHLYTFDVCLRLLALEPAVGRDDWSDLVESVCSEKQRMMGYMSFGDDEARELFDKRWVDNHLSRDRLLGVARKAFPFAGL